MPTLTIDLLVLVLNRSIFHPFITLLIPICLRAVQTPPDSPKFLVSCAWAILISLLAIFQYISHRIAHGPPRQVDWDEELVIITGGASGLGRVLAQMFGMNGASVAVLDLVKPPNEEEGEEEEEGMQNVKYYVCDVASAEELERTKQRIEKDFPNQPPTILINNAATLLSLSFLSLTPSQIHHSLTVNLHSHFLSTHTFLPSLLSARNGAHIITVSSVLGKLGAAGLSDYTAAKAGAIAFHRSLRGELDRLPPFMVPPTTLYSSPDENENENEYDPRPLPHAAPGPRIKTVLVTPGHLTTPLFSHVSTPSQFLAPLVSPVELAKKVVELVRKGEGGEISLPLYAGWIEWFGVLPAGVQKIVRWASGVDDVVMDAGGKERKRGGGCGREGQGEGKKVR